MARKVQALLMLRSAQALARKRTGGDMVAVANRKRSARMVAAEAPRSTGSLIQLPAGAPEVIEPDNQPHLAVAAMSEQTKPKATTTTTPTKNSTKSVPVKAPPPAVVPGGDDGPKDKEDDYKGQDPKGMGGAKSHSTGRTGDPDVAYAFSVKIGEVQYAMFSEISGLSWKAEPIPVRSGGNNEYGLNMRGPGKFEPLTLKRGWFASTGEFFDMLKESLSGEAPRGTSQTGRVNITVTVLDRKYHEVGNYDFANAFIIEYSGPALNSMSGQIGFEQIRMAYDYFTYRPK